MPTQQQVWMIADHLRAKPERVSLRNVRAALPRGGSFRDIGEHLASWKAHREYQPRIELAQLPERLQNELAGFGKAVWDASMQEATRQLEADRQRAEGLVAVERQLREEALTRTDVLEALVGVLQAEVDTLRAELVVAREEAKGLRRKVKGVRTSGSDGETVRREERQRSRAFWARVMEEVRGILQSRPSGRWGLTREQILERLSSDLVADGRAHGEDLSPSNLSKRLYERVLRGKFFMERDGVYYLRTADGAEV